MMVLQRFLEACKSGDIKTLHSLDYSKIDIHAGNEWSFRWACKNGHLVIVKFLLTLEPDHGRIDIHADDEEAFQEACHNGHLDVAKYLISLEPSHGRIDIHARNELAFQWACLGSHIYVVKFLLTLEPDHGRIDIHAGDDYAFNISNFLARNILTHHDPNYKWRKVKRYESHRRNLNQIVKCLSTLHQKMIQIDTDILELNVMGIIKEYLV
jgi:ankyrin repeat protein